MASPKPSKLTGINLKSILRMMLEFWLIMRLLEVKFDLLSVNLDLVALEGHRYGVVLAVLPIRGELKAV